MYWLRLLCYLVFGPPLTCADCGGLIGADDGPEDGWVLEDGRTVCHACCVADLKRITSRKTSS